jgi:hypothetical protein
MAHHDKKLHVRSASGKHDTFEAETIEKALRDLATQAKHGDLELPCTVTFDGPAGLAFSVTISDADAAQQMTTFGFMF